MSERVDLSRPTIYQPNTLVSHPKYGDGVLKDEYVRPTDPSVGYIYFNNSEGKPDVSGYTYWTIVSFYKNMEKEVRVDELSVFSWEKFLLWRQPTGEWMHGKNPAIGAGIRYAALLGFSIYGATQVYLSPYWLFMVAAPLAVIGLMLLGTRRNFEGKQM